MNFTLKPSLPVYHEGTCAEVTVKGFGGKASVLQGCRHPVTNTISGATSADVVKLLAEIPDPSSAPPVLLTESEPRRQKVARFQVSSKMPPKPDSGVREALEDRDPNTLNQHLQIVWDDIIGEPEGARSPECAWRLSHACFRYTRNWCYTLLSVLAAPPCALLLGCGFACLAFEQIWCTTPCLRCVKIYFASLRTLVQSCMAATVAPAMEAVGHVCRHVRINVRKDAPEERDLLIV